MRSIQIQLLALSLSLLCASTLSAQDFDVFMDQRDGKVYQVVKIGEQVWMAENLSFESKSARVIYPNNSPLVDVFGRLYSWEVAQEVCPEGMHLPSEGEFEQLADYLGGAKVAGAKMKKISAYWSSTIDPLSNSSGFSGIPGGYLEDPADSSYPFMGDMGFFWSATEKSRSEANFKYLKIDSDQFKTGNGPKESGMSVRCLMD